MNAHFPATYSILSAAEIAARILPGFDIGAVSTCQFFIGGFNDTYRITTQEGVIYYMRVYRAAWRTLPDILYEIEVLNHLAHKEFPAIRPLPFQDGKFYCELNAPEGLRYAVLFSEASGKLISYDHEPEKMAFRYGQAVAGLHNAVADFACMHQRFQIDLSLLVEGPLRHIAPFLSHRPDQWTYLQNFARDLLRRIESLPENKLERGYCHGDLQGYHANISRDGTLTFFDFDCGGFGYRAYDLAVFRWCSRLKNQEAVWWEPYLKGYRSLRPIADLDVQAVPLFVAARCIWHMGVHTQNSPDWGREWLNDAYFDEKLNYLRALEKDYYSTPTLA